MMNQGDGMNFSQLMPFLMRIFGSMGGAANFGGSPSPRPMESGGGDMSSLLPFWQKMFGSGGMNSGSSAGSPLNALNKSASPTGPSYFNQQQQGPQGAAGGNAGKLYGMWGSLIGPRTPQ